MGRWADAVRRRIRRIATDRPATDVTVVVRGVIPCSFRSTDPAHTGGTGALSLSFFVRATGGADWARPSWCASSDDLGIMTDRGRFRQTPHDPRRPGGRTDGRRRYDSTDIRSTGVSP